MDAGSVAAAACGDRSPTNKPGRRRWAPRGGEDDADEEPAVLVLSYFFRPPFLSFGRLRVGASRTRLLGIDNPNEDDAEVVIDRFPAAARGFSIEHRRFFVEVRGDSPGDGRELWRPQGRGLVRSCPAAGTGSRAVGRLRRAVRDWGPVAARPEGRRQPGMAGSGPSG